ncbi:hypothetical protein [Serratia ureilytica]|uniref:hypothetical protein n=1 Tax=Serratia ureilytica TaxID=300181 RepID=UPI003716FE50
MPQKKQYAQERRNMTRQTINGRDSRAGTMSREAIGAIFSGNDIGAASPFGNLYRPIEEAYKKPRGQ